MVKFLAVVLVIFGGANASIWDYTTCVDTTDTSVLNSTEWWGSEESKENNDTSIREFQVEFNSTMIADLRERLNNHRNSTPPLEGYTGFQYGFNSDLLDEYLTYWAETYSFDERVEFLNQYPQYKTNIQGLDIHFIRITPTVSDGVEVVPLLMMHGWPGSVREFYEAIPLLTQENSTYCTNDFVFELIIPSLPGYGFSDAPARTGMGAAQVAVIMTNLMKRLGFDQFYVQGGDWGSVVASLMATLYPDNILGHHTNLFSILTFCTDVKTFLGAFLPSSVLESGFANTTYPLFSLFGSFVKELGYFHLQATKPDTIGVTLSDSPVSLLVYFLEKFATWTNSELKLECDGGLSSYFTKDQLIDNLMIYWSSNSITSSMRLYAETMSEANRNLSLECVPTSVPTWIMQPKYELFQLPTELSVTKYTNLLNVTTLDDGGHFIAFEQPETFAEDVFKAVKAFRDYLSDQ